MYIPNIDNIKNNSTINIIYKIYINKTIIIKRNMSCDM